MLNVALTGNIAAGKSTVAELFRRWGATIIDADRLVREAQAPGSPVLAAIAERFGRGLIEPRAGSTARRSAAACWAIPRRSPTSIAIVHPEVLRRRAALEARGAGAAATAIVVSDIPLLFEAADPAAFDAIVLVDAPAAVRRARLLAERGLDG